MHKVKAKTKRKTKVAIKKEGETKKMFSLCYEICFSETKFFHDKVKIVLIKENVNNVFPESQMQTPSKFLS